MPCTGLPLTTPNISCLDYLLTWDLSGATPKVTITNNSTVSNAANLNWWFYVVSPNGAAIYGVDLSTVSPLPTPDFSGVAWTTKVINLPTPFGNPPCGQIEFSPTNPYNVYVYVTDSGFSTTSFFTYNKNTLLPRPNGNGSNSCGNFGNAAVNMKVDCGAQSILVSNGTNLIYNNILTPESSSNAWTLVYPQTASGSIPNVVVNNQANVNFVTSINSAGYVLYFQQYATYNYGNGITVIVQYKLFTKGTNISPELGQQFAINCNTNLCLLQCQMQRFYKASKGSCGTLENQELRDKMVEMSFLFNQIITGIFQPLCGIDIPKLMAEITAIGNFDPNCDCNCNGNNFGFSNPTGNGSGGNACCPIYTSVVTKVTGDPPANCPNGYFPANVYDPTGTSIIGNALSMADEIAIINANAAWQAYGTAFDAGSCKVGFFPATGVTTVPNVIVDPNAGGGGSSGGGGSTGVSGGGNGVVVIPVIDPFGYPPVQCPNSYFPAQVYNPTATTIIGVASDITSLVGIINANAAWQAIGTAYAVDNCHVGIYPKPGVTTFPPGVVVTYSGGGGGIDTGCVNGQQLYPVTISDICFPSSPPITTSSFPLNVYIDFGLGAGLQFVGNATSQANMITELNADASKPATVTFSAGSTVSQVIVSNSNCTAYSGVITIKADAGSDDFLLYASNHQSISSNSTINNAETALGIKTLSRLGGLNAGPTEQNFWHNITIGNILMATSPGTGKVYFWDITNPLMPALSRIIQLNAVVGNCFTGVPQSETLATATASPSYSINTLFDLYFPTDTYTLMSLNAIYVVESLTGCIWQLNYYDTGSGVVASFQSDLLIGKCPRVLANHNGKLSIYFTQDGDLEQATSQSSGVAEGNIVVLDVSVFSSGGLTQVAIFLNAVEYVWAASYDGNNTIYFSGNKGSVATYSVSPSSIVSRYLYVAGVGELMTFRSNSIYYMGILYVTPQQMSGFNGLIIDTTTLATVPVVTTFQQPTAGGMDGLFNFKPLGNCLGVMTSARIPGVGVSYVALYFLNGTYVADIPLNDTEEYYNVIPIPGVVNTTPNNFTP